MMKQIIFMLTFILFSSMLSNVFAQVSIEWEQNYGGSNYDVIVDTKQTSDGGFIMAGITSSSDVDVSGNNNGGKDYWLVKTNAFGYIEWEQNYGTVGLDNIVDFCQADDGGFLLVGNSNSSDGDCWIVKTDAVGNMQWEKHYQHQYQPNNSYAPESVKSCYQTSDGGFVIFGNGLSSGGSHPNENYWAFKINALGVREWNNIYDRNTFEFLRVAQPTSDGGYLLGGYSFNEPFAQPGDRDYWLVKIDAFGNKEWDKIYGGDDWEELTHITPTDDGGYLLGGNSNSTGTGDVGGNYGYNDIWIVKIDGVGNLQWEQNYGGNNNDIVTEIYQTSDGGFIIGATSSSNTDDVSGHIGLSDFWVVKADANGNIEWENSYGGYLEDLFVQLEPTNDGGFILGGVSRPYFNIPYDYFLVKIDGLGNVEWEDTYGGAGEEFFKEMIQTNDNGILVTGNSEGPASGSGAVGGNNGDYDFWVIKIKGDNCLPYFAIDPNTILQPEFKASLIETVGNVIITSSDAITFKSNETILNRDFEVQSNGIFCIYNELCIGLNPRPEQAENNTNISNE